MSHRGFAAWVHPRCQSRTYRCLPSYPAMPVKYSSLHVMLNFVPLGLTGALTVTKIRSLSYQADRENDYIHSMCVCGFNRKYIYSITLEQMRISFDLGSSNLGRSPKYGPIPRLSHRLSFKYLLAATTLEAAATSKLMRNCASSATGSRPKHQESEPGVRQFLRGNFSPVFPVEPGVSH